MVVVPVKVWMVPVKLFVVPARILIEKGHEKKDTPAELRACLFWYGFYWVPSDASR